MGYFTELFSTNEDISDSTGPCFGLAANTSCGDSDWIVR
jgi:hypothetical protein